MHNPFRITKRDILFIKWRKCLLLYNNNEENNEPLKCQYIHNLYMKEVNKNLDIQSKKKE